MAGKDLEVQGLYKSFGSLKVLQDVSFSVPAGTVFGFVGANGAGKTTTMRIIMGITAADAGTYTLGGVPIGITERQTIGYMPEERGLYPKMKVADQLVYFARLHGFSKAEAQASMETWTDRLGVAARRGDAVEKLSLGNQQRVQLAAALIHNPAALILDEPFSGLDPVAVDVMSEVLHEHATGGVPVIFSSHQLELVERLCDSVGIISGGKIAAQGSVTQLRAGAPARLRLLGDAAAHTAALEVARNAGVEFTQVDTERGPELQCATAPESELGSRLVRAALDSGTVRYFGPVEPTLAEMFREYVTPAQAQEEEEVA